ncbi:MAG: hypothetical protein K2M91_04680 [Lachnospiraceae bacterium]|nr:hypothetical protein [Lachnospiraceae bacterium]
MAMRITTKMMQNTSLRNLNTNKSRQEKLVNQMSTGKKIMRPSDDPVIAIRSLKLNASLDKIDQYYEKNVSDADSWLELTLSALSTVNNILENDVRSNIISAKSSYKTAEDRKSIIEHLQKAMAEIYSTGNADSAGRSIFTGYRTDMPLTMKNDKHEKNRITEQFNNDSIDQITFVYAGDIKNINDGNFKDIDDITTKEISSNQIFRKRLAYGDIDLNEVYDADGKPFNPPQYESNLEIGYMSDSYANGNGASIGTTSVGAYVTIDTTKVPNEAVFTVTDTSVTPAATTTVRIPKGQDSTSAGVTGLPTGITLSYGADGTITLQNDNAVPKETATIGSSVTKDANGKNVVEFDKKYKTTFTIEPENIFASGSNDAYMSVVGENNKSKISYIASTGEVLFGEEFAKRLKELPADTELRVTYDKSNWQKNDLDPVHYFYTEREGKTASGKEKTLVYNENFLENPGADGKQIIEYDVGNNQSLQVNTPADEAFSHGLGRDVEEVIAMLEEYTEYDNSLTAVKKMIESKQYEGTDDELLLTRQKEALEEAMTRLGDKITKRCDELLDNCDGFFEKSKLAETNCGARLSRLRMVENRLSMEQTNFQELVSENEDADYTDLVIQLKSIEMTYNAALSSIAYVMQTSLLDFVR